MLALMAVKQPPEMTGHSLLSQASRPAILAAPHGKAVASA
jgi:2,3-bisphosphoglycerate-independent phosphoglycerate mutase